MMSSPRFTRRFVLAGGAAWALTGCSGEQTQDDAGGSSVSPGSSSASQQTEMQATPSSSSTASGLDHSSPGSIYVLVNKLHPLDPPTWAPEDLEECDGVLLRAEAAQAARQMFTAAAHQGINLKMRSGYRSYEQQVGTYSTWVSAYGQEAADTASARPGYSEHQTGLAFDIGTGSSCDLQPCFADTPEAQWAAQNCQDYGFILRFPYGEHEVTGYYFESWHFRYIGREQAQLYAEQEAKNLEYFWGFEAAPTFS